jgi:hypothetical protein
MSRDDPPVTLMLIYQTFAKLLGWMVPPSDTAKEIEILVLRHQLAVLQRRTQTTAAAAGHPGTTVGLPGPRRGCCLPELAFGLEHVRLG